MDDRAQFVRPPRNRASRENRPRLVIGAHDRDEFYPLRKRARLVEAEAQVPKAMADALRKGNLGVMDNYQMKNIMADTDMRSSISGMGDGDKK